MRKINEYAGFCYFVDSLWIRGITAVCSY